MANSFEFIQQRPTIQNALDQAQGLGLDTIAFDTFVDVGDRATIWKTLFSDGILTFESDYKCPFKHIAATIEPVQDLHGYDSPWPAGGGKNLFNKDTVTMDEWIIADSTDIDHSVGYAVSDFIPVTQGAIYYIGAKGSARSAYYDTEKNGIEYFPYSGGSAFTARYTGYMRFTLYSDDYSAFLSTLQFEANSTPTYYAPYSNICPISGWTGADINLSGEDTSDPEMLSINWQDEAGTVYGGNLAIDEDGSCKLTITHAIEDFDGSSDEQWSKGSYENYRIPIAGMSVVPASTNGILACNRLKPIAFNDRGATTVPCIMCVGSEATIELRRLSTLNITTVAELRTWLSNNPVSAVYPLATPITYTLPDVTMLSSLLGTNNIWASTGGIAVTYKDINPLFLTDPLNVGVMTLK